MKYFSRQPRLTPQQKLSRIGFLAGTLFFLSILRGVTPSSFADLHLHTSCGAITGLPCLFCGLTRALHFLLHADFKHALYFNWLAFPIVAGAIFLGALFIVELLSVRQIFRFDAIFDVTARRISIAGSALVLLWLLQVYLAVSQHKSELLNPNGPLYALFVK